MAHFTSHACHTGDQMARQETQPQGVSSLQQPVLKEDSSGANSHNTGLRNILRSSDAALASRAYACAPSKSAAGHSNNTSTSGSGSVLIHSRGSSIQEAPAAPQEQSEAHSQAPATNPSESGCSEAAKAESKQASAPRSALVDAQSAGTTSAGEGTRVASKVRQDNDDLWLSSNQQRSETQAPAAASSSSSFPLKLAEVTEADRLEMRSQAVPSTQSVVVSRVLGRLGGSVLSQPTEVRPVG